MNQERINEARELGKAIGEELGKKNRVNDQKEYLQKQEHTYKRLMYFINLSVIISYIAGALLMQLPFIEKLGIIPYDFKLYLLIGALIFVIIQFVLFICSFYEQIVSHIVSQIVDYIIEKVRHYFTANFDHLINIYLRIIFIIPLTLLLISLLETLFINYLPEYYHNLFYILIWFIKIYISFSLLFQDKLYTQSMNTNNFIFIIIALSISLYIGKGDLEKYLLTDAKLISSSNENQIELITIDKNAIYYKINDQYKYEILRNGTIIEFNK